MVKLTQKTTVIDGEKIAFVETEIDDGKYTYRVLFDQKTKKRFNAFAKANGFVIGKISSDASVPERVMEI